MNHAISNAGSAEADYYRQVGLEEATRLRSERMSAACEKIIQAFDGQDAMTSFDVVSDKDPARMHELYAALAGVVHVPLSGVHDARLFRVVKAFHAVAHYYAGYQSASELS